MSDEFSFLCGKAYKSEFLCTFAIDSSSPVGRDSHDLLLKDVYVTLSSTVESRKFHVTEETQPKRPRGVYCTLFTPIL